MNLPAGEGELSERLSQLYGLARIREAAESTPVYLVGGAVRDILLGKGRVDVDVAAEGDAEEIARRLGGAAVVHERFSTATIQIGELTIDLATTRSETYSRPGALPEVAPAAIDADLGRRDFTINAMAIPLQGEPRLVDPHGGREDLGSGTIRVLHAGSFVDDPTRALRAARYAARLGFELDRETDRLVRAIDFEAVSADRYEAEMMRLCGEPSAASALALLADWGLIDLAPDATERVEAVGARLADAPWAGLADPALAVHAAAFGHAPGPAGRLRDLLASAESMAGAAPERPSEAAGLAAGRSGVELVLARVMGAGWLDRYLTEWREVRLEITGADLLDAGVPEGPAVGRGLDAALRMKLDGEIAGRDAELAAAVAAADS